MISMRWHGLVKCGVKNGHLRGLRYQGLCNPDAHQVGGIVQRRQWNGLLYGLDDLIVAGGNYGWNIREGSNSFRGRGRSATGLIDPVASRARVCL